MSRMHKHLQLQGSGHSLFLHIFLCILTLPALRVFAESWNKAYVSASYTAESHLLDRSSEENVGNGLSFEDLSRLILTMPRIYTRSLVCCALRWTRPSEIPGRRCENNRNCDEAGIETLACLLR